MQVLFAFRLFSFVITDAGTQLRKYLAGSDVRARQRPAEYFYLTIAHLFTRISGEFVRPDSQCGSGIGRRRRRNFYRAANNCA